MNKEETATTYALLSQIRTSIFTNPDDLILAMDNIIESILPKWISVEERLPEENIKVLVKYEPKNPTMEYITTISMVFPIDVIKQIEPRYTKDRGMNFDKNGFQVRGVVVGWMYIPK